MSWSAIVSAGLVTTLVVAPLAAEPGGRSQTNRSGLPRLAIDLQPTAHDLIAVLTQISARSRSPFALEIVLGSGGVVSRTAQATVPNRPGEFVYDLTGLAVEEAMRKVADLTAAGNSRVIPYEWSFDGGVHHFRPRQFRNNTGVALNRRIAHFEANPTDVHAALMDVHRVFQPQYPSRPTQAPQRMPERLRHLFERPLTIALDNTTVRGILDEMVRQHGATSWLAEYSDVTGSYKGLRLSFIGFDGWQVSAAADTR